VVQTERTDGLTITLRSEGGGLKPGATHFAVEFRDAITGRLRDALGLVDIRVLDHIVVGDGACVSFAERGLL
jgi:hypothetical protein